MIDIGYWAGWVALGFGTLVAPPQLYRMLRTGKSRDVSLTTYVFLCLAMIGYLIHAVYIGAEVFILAQSLNLSVNGIILAVLIQRRLKYGR